MEENDRKGGKRRLLDSDKGGERKGRQRKKTLNVEEEERKGKRNKKVLVGRTMKWKEGRNG